MACLQVIPLVKPLIISCLEDQNCCLSIGQTLSALEIIVFVFNVLKNNLLNKEEVVSLKELYQLLDHCMSGELKSISDHTLRPSPSTACDCPSDHKLFLANFLNDFIESKIIFVDWERCSIGLNRQLIPDVQEMLDKSLTDVFENYLMSQLIKYGPKPIDFIEMKLIKHHFYLIKYLFNGQSSCNLLDWTQSKANLFDVFGRDVSVVTVPDDSLTTECPECIHSSPTCQQLSGKVGVSSYGTYDDMKFYITCDEDESSRYEIDKDLVQILGHRMNGDQNSIAELIHENDMVVFESQLANSTQMDTADDNNNNNTCVWLVSQIIQVRHRALCYVPNGKKMNNYFY